MLVRRPLSRGTLPGALIPALSTPAGGAAVGGASNKWLGGQTGEVARLLTAKVGDTVNLRDYGGVCDGSTDNAPALVAAATALSSAGGGTLEINAGALYYKISSIEVNQLWSGVRIVGRGKPRLISAATSPMFKFAGYPTQPYTGTGDALTGDYRPGDRTVTRSTTTQSLAQGDIVILMSSNSPNVGDVPYGEWNVVEGVSGNDVTLRYRLRKILRPPVNPSGYAFQILKRAANPMNFWIENCYLEQLTQSPFNVHGVNFGIRNCEIKGLAGPIVRGRFLDFQYNLNIPATLWYPLPGGRNPYVFAVDTLTTDFDAKFTADVGGHGYLHLHEGVCFGRVDAHVVNAPTDWSTLASGTAQAATNSTITLDSGDTAVDNGWGFSLIRITGGTGVGQVRLIAANVASTKVATISVNWKTNPDSTSTYEICEADGVLDLSGGNHDLDLKVNVVNAPHGFFVNCGVIDNYRPGPERTRIELTTSGKAQVARQRVSAGTPTMPIVLKPHGDGRSPTIEDALTSDPVWCSDEFTYPIQISDGALGVATFVTVGNDTCVVFPESGGNSSWIWQRDVPQPIINWRYVRIMAELEVLGAGEDGTKAVRIDLNYKQNTTGSSIPSWSTGIVSRFPLVWGQGSLVYVSAAFAVDPTSTNRRIGFNIGRIPGAGSDTYAGDMRMRRVAASFFNPTIV